jgi:hypothetical protein
LSLSNDRDVVTIGKNGVVVGDLPSVTPLLSRNGQIIANLTIELDEVPTLFDKTSYYSYTDGILKIEGIPEGFVDGKFVFTYNDLKKEFTLSTVQA